MALHIRTARVIGMAAVIILMSCGLGWAQPAGVDPSFERMRAKLKAGDRVTVELQNGRDGPLFGLTFLGLGAGAGIDALVNIPRTVYQRTPSHTAFRVEAGPRRTAVRLVIAF